MTPCWEEVVDTTSCNESLSTECFGCKQVIPTPCTNCPVWRDYSGLEINECHDGCPGDQYNNVQICYEEKLCGFEQKDDKFCMECQGEEICVGITPPSGGKCYTLGDCAVEIACDIVKTCFLCVNTNIVNNEVFQWTCDCD